MPWKETSAMDQRILFIADYLSGDYTKSALCRHLRHQPPVGRHAVNSWSASSPRAMDAGLFFYYNRAVFCRGEMAEWLKAHAWKACLGETLTWVRIPLSPPGIICNPFYLNNLSSIQLRLIPHIVPHLLRR